MNATVLCADDDHNIRELVRATLAAEQMQVVVVTNGAEALEAAIRLRPDAILLDIHMPVMDGLQALGWIKARAELTQVPVMVITSDSEAENVRTALARGARDFVVKPFEPAELRRRVRRLLGGERVAPPASPDAGGPVTPRRVLIVSDQTSTLSVAEGILRGRHEVARARGAAAAAAQAASFTPDVVVVDLALPVAQAAELLVLLGEGGGDAPVRFVALAGTEAEMAQAAVFDATVVKPLTGAQLLAAVERVPAAR